MTDIGYETERNKLIPFAEKYANKLHGAVYAGDGSEADRQRYAEKWTRCFIRRMNRLWEIRKGKKCPRCHGSGFDFN